MKTIIVTESKLDEAILTRVIKASELKLRGTLKFMPSATGAVSVARTYLLAPDTRVVLIVDADSIDASEVEDMKRDINELLGMVASVDRFKVLVMEPEMEAVFFQDRQWASKAFGSALTDEVWRRAQLAPKKELGRLLNAKGTGWQEMNELLNRLDWAALAKLDVFKPLMVFLAEDHVLSTSESR